MPQHPSTTRPVEGWAQFAGDGQWRAARFALSGTDAGLYVHPEGEPDATGIDLGLVTSLDELDGAPDGFHRVELELDRVPYAQCVWPAAFTDSVLDALRDTLSEQAAGPTRTGEFVNAREPVAADRRALRVGLIGLLALLGIVAMAIGAVTLKNATNDDDPTTPEITSTTVEGAAR